MRFVIPFTMLLSACTTFPPLEGTISDAAREAPYPTLTEIPVQPTPSIDGQSAMQTRVDALQARAARIRQIDMAALQ